MLKIIKTTLFKNTFIYMLLQVINKGIPFLLLPVLTRYLSTDEYGIIATYNTFLSFVSIFIGLSLHGAVGVNFFHLKKDELQRFIGNVFNILLVSTIIVTFLVVVFQEFIYEQIDIPIFWMYIAIIVALMQNITGINLTLWMSEQRAKPYTIYEILQTLFNIIISLILVIVCHYNWEGRVTGTASAAIIFGLISILVLYKRGYATLDFSIGFIKDALKFGIPLIPHQMALWMRTGIDILLITSIVGIVETGIYSVGYQLGAVVGIVAHAFNNAYSPYLFGKLQNISEENKRKLVRFSYLYFVGIVFFAIGISWFFSLILPYLLGEKFQEASHYIIWVALAFSFNGMYLMIVNYIFYVKKTHLLSMVTITTSIFHVILSYTLIHAYGAIGAAYASVISFFIAFVLVWRISYKVYVMPWFFWQKNHVEL